MKYHTLIVSLKYHKSKPTKKELKDYKKWQEKQMDENVMRLKSFHNHIGLKMKKLKGKIRKLVLSKCPFCKKKFTYIDKTSGQCSVCQKIWKYEI